MILRVVLVLTVIALLEWVSMSKFLGAERIPATISPLASELKTNRRSSHSIPRHREARVVVRSAEATQFEVTGIAPTDESTLNKDKRAISVLDTNDELR